jgi:hypothetical protein
MVPASLPDLDRLDLEAMKALVIAKHSESIEQHKSDAELIEHLKLVIEKYRRMIFGRKSEKLTGQLEQLELRLEELETAHAAEEAARRNQLRLRQHRSIVPARHANLCLKIFRGKWSPIFLRTTAAPIAAVRYASSVKTYPNNWNASRQPTK